MPNCFQLVPIGTDIPENLNAVDEKICRLLGQDVHPKYYAADWFNELGFYYALGRTFAEVRESVAGSDRLTKINDWLEKNYTINCWAEH